MNTASEQPNGSVARTERRCEERRVAAAEVDESDVCELKITADGTVYAFGLTRKVMDVLEQLGGPRAEGRETQP